MLPNLKVQSLSGVLTRRLSDLRQTIQECNGDQWKQIPYYFQSNPDNRYTACKTVEHDDGSFGVYYPGDLVLTRIGSTKSGRNRCIYLALHDSDNNKATEYFKVHRYFDNSFSISQMELYGIPHPVLLQWEDGSGEPLSTDLIQYHEKMGIKTYYRWEKIKTWWAECN